MKFNSHQKDSGLSTFFEIPDDWWQEAGMCGFFLGASTSYSFCKDVSDVKLVQLTDIAPPKRTLNCDRDFGVFDRQRMVSILEGFLQDSIIPPIQIQKSLSGLYAYELRAGFHRFYASIAAGFKYIPVVIVPDLGIK